MGLKLLAVALTSALLTHAQSLPSGPDKELVEAVCGACHSTERIVDQHLSKTQWQSLVLEMLQENPEVTQPERDGGHRLASDASRSRTADSKRRGEGAIDPVRGALVR